jgi:hypothetical protein
MHFNFYTYRKSKICISGIFVVYVVSVYIIMVMVCVQWNGMWNPHFVFFSCLCMLRALSKCTLPLRKIHIVESITLKETKKALSHLGETQHKRRQMQTVSSFFWLTPYAPKQMTMAIMPIFNFCTIPASFSASAVDIWEVRNSSPIHRPSPSTSLCRHSAPPESSSNNLLGLRYK